MTGDNNVYEKTIRSVKNRPSHASSQDSMITMNIRDLCGRIIKSAPIRHERPVRLLACAHASTSG